MIANKPIEYKEASISEPLFEETNQYVKSAPTKRGVALLAVTTFYERDLPLLRKRAEYMQFIGCQPTNDIVLIGDSDITQEMLAEAVELNRPFFKSVFTHRMGASAVAEGWPRNVNKAFRQTVWFLNGFGNNKFANTPYLGWLYFESDITPLVPDFMKKLERQYLVCWNEKKRFMGITGEIKSPKGQVVKCMNGAGVYPFGMQYFNEKMMLTENIPWDVAGLSGVYLKDIHSLSYSQYAMHFSTWEYKKTGERQFDCIKRRHAGPEEQDKCTLTDQWLHHGCKDGTLIDLLMGKAIAEKSQPKPESLIAQVIKLPETTSIHPQMYDILKDHAAGMKWQALIGKYKIAPKVLKSILNPKEK